ncbi:MAG: SDR family NAD(P)-dependent oxidoreductase [Bacteroidales bacterium]|nr:SDR family NAD(P)-dependent oxidoreductase [Bacteroidales bacterium]
MKSETPNLQTQNTSISRNIWITGASSGIGEALAMQLSAPGTTIILSGLEKQQLEPVATKCELKGAHVHIVPFNLTKEDEITEAANTVQALVPKIDILANVGGIGQRSLIIETPADVARKIMETDFWGHASLTTKILPFMVKTGGGTIVVMSSLSGLFGFPQRSLYCAAKHALHGFFETLRLEHHKDKINVLMVCPGRVKTNFSYGALTSTGDTHGKMDKGQENGVSVEYCAAKIDWAVRKNKKQILVGRKELIMAYLKRYAPWLFYWIALRIDPNA